MSKIIFTIPTLCSKDFLDVKCPIAHKARLSSEFPALYKMPLVFQQHGRSFETEQVGKLVGLSYASELDTNISNARHYEEGTPLFWFFTKEQKTKSQSGFFLLTVEILQLAFKNAGLFFDFTPRLCPALAVERCEQAIEKFESAFSLFEIMVDKASTANEQAVDAKTAKNAVLYCSTTFTHITPMLNDVPAAIQLALDAVRDSCPATLVKSDLTSVETAPNVEDAVVAVESVAVETFGSVLELIQRIDDYHTFLNGIQQDLLDLTQDYLEHQSVSSLTEHLDGGLFSLLRHEISQDFSRENLCRDAVQIIREVQSKKAN